jgi:hypothetical protein
MCVQPALTSSNSAFLPQSTLNRLHVILRVNSYYFLKQHQPLVLCNGKEVWCVLEVRTQYLNIIKTSFGFKGRNFELDNCMKLY